MLLTQPEKVTCEYTIVVGFSAEMTNSLSEFAMPVLNSIEKKVVYISAREMQSKGRSLWFM
jgi:hypothetical protein